MWKCGRPFQPHKIDFGSWQVGRSVCRHSVKGHQFSAIHLHILTSWPSQFFRYLTIAFNSSSPQSIIFTIPKSILNWYKACTVPNQKVKRARVVQMSQFDFWKCEFRRNIIRLTFKVCFSLVLSFSTFRIEQRRHCSIDRYWRYW